MLAADLLSTATKGVTANKSRSLLTMLGIIIGVGSVVLMTGIGKSMEGLILGQISVLGSESLVVFPGTGPEGGASAARSGFDSVTFDDAKAIARLDTVKDVAPVMFVPGKVVHGREEAEPTVLGTTAQYFANLSINLQEGRMLDDSDEKSARAVALMGSDAASDLFYNENPLGKRIKLGGRTFTVVGVLESVGTAFFVNVDDRIYIPLKTAKDVTQQKYYNIVTMSHTGNPDLAIADIKSLLRQRHKIDNPEDDDEKDDFIVRSSNQAQDILGAVSIGLTSFITTIAAISLIVGGIGIMNIMLVAVTERTREIGLRKALGATRRDILLQFLVESVFLTFIGGVIGIVCGVLFALFIALIIGSFLSDYLFAISSTSILMATAMAMGTGLLFGIFPARKAALLNPIEALRYE